MLLNEAHYQGALLVSTLSAIRYQTGLLPKTILCEETRVLVQIGLSER